ncbi:hypothetical protein B0T14DRAFT_221851 [Immersiella caudata]|uniref:PHD-type domain-containing protein n=1 Tax=Immersiella caudata TaxID=314043 RepID=A0AA40C0C9_9PEZI|nr:hypothetical protein B0T14DRAFT_221851 [Immersiella caudata]
MSTPNPAPTAGVDAPGDTTKGAAPGPLATPSPTPGTAPSTAKSASPVATRPMYIPQFSAATQLILKRMKGEPSNLSSALSAATATSTGAVTIKTSTYEDVKRRLVMGMNTSASMTIQMPTATSVSPKPSTIDSIPMPRPGPQSAKSTGSAIRRISSGLTASGKAPVTKAPAAKPPALEPKTKKTKATTAAKPTSHKRKRTKGDDSDGSSSDLSDFPEKEPTLTDSTPAAPLTMTKSGRQVQKPATYNPAAMDAATRKRTHYGKRTAEQALCKKCTRMQSPADNQIVFCDGCNDAWHQRCHDPWIEDAVIRDENRSWYCGVCVEKRARHLAKRQKVEAKIPVGPPPRESWASKTPQQRRAYLMSLPSQELVNLITISLELHPDLPIFPGTPAEPSGAGSAQGSVQPRSLFAGATIEGLFPRADANPTGQMNYIRRAPSSTGSAKGRGNGGKTQSHPEDTHEKAEEEEEEDDPLAALWPRAGRGLYSKLPPDTEDAERLVDDDDYEAFSVIVYDERGRKVEENGMKV